MRPLRRRGAAALVLCIAMLGTGATEAAADLKLCNSTGGRVGVALGYQDDSGWATEGWWNIPAQSCETLLKGGVPSRFLYVYAVDYDRGGEWVGTNFMCTTDKTFRILDTKNCQQRGHLRKGFFEVDTGSAKDWTIRLSEPEDGARQR